MEENYPVGQERTETTTKKNIEQDGELDVDQKIKSGHLNVTPKTGKEEELQEGEPGAQGRKGAGRLLHTCRISQ